MPISMTKEEYKAKYGVTPVVSANTFDTKPAPIRMTMEEYNNAYIKKPSGFLDPKGDDFLRFKDTSEGATLKDAPKLAATTPLKSIANLITSPVRTGLNLLKIGGGIRGGAEEGIFTAPKDEKDLPTGKQSPFVESAKETVVEPITKGLSALGNVVLGTMQRGVKRITGIDLGDEESEQAISALVEHAKNQKLEDAGKIAEFVQTMVTERPEEVVAILAGIEYTTKGKLPTEKGLISRIGEPIETGITKGIKAVTPAKISAGEKLVTNRLTALESLENQYAVLRKNNSFTKDNGAASRDRIARTDVLVDAVDADGTIHTKQPGGPVEQYRKQTIDGTESVVRDLLVKEGKKVNIAEIERQLLLDISNSTLEGGDLVTALNGVKKEIKGLSLIADEFGDILLEKVHDAKINTTKNINFQTPPEKATYRKTVARTYKEMIQNKSSEEVGKINAELGKFYQDINRLEALDGRKVKGGRMSKYFAQVGGQVAGAAFGSTVGGGVGAGLGSIVGGELSGLIRGKSLARTFGKGGTKAPKNSILDEASRRAKSASAVNLKVPDRKVGAAKGIKKNKEILKLERDIAKNVKAQKTAIKAGDFELVSKLKEIYKFLVDSLKKAVQTVKDTPNKQGGFIRFDNRAKPPKQKGEALSPKKLSELQSSVKPTTNKGISKDLAQEAQKFDTAEEFVEQFDFVDQNAKTPGEMRGNSQFTGLKNGDQNLNSEFVLFRGTKDGSPVTINKSRGEAKDGAFFFTENRNLAEDFGKVSVSNVKLGRTLVSDSFDDAYEILFGREIPESLLSKGEGVFERNVSKKAIEKGFDSMVWTTGGPGDGAGAMPQVIILNKDNISEITKSQLTDIYNQAKNK